MKERPILFSGPMVRALLSGQKTQTRRPVKPQPVHEPEPVCWRWSGRAARQAFAGIGDATAFARLLSDACPHGAPGDRLWVRETFALSIRDPDSAFEPDAKDPSCWDGAVYRADGEQQGGGWDRYEGGVCVARGVAPTWRPAIHMPRWASRLLLEVTDVRVERLDAITEEDARAEGMDLVREPGDADLRYTVRRLWNSMYGGGPFDGVLDPWVWVVSFHRIDAKSGLPPAGSGEGGER